LVSYDLIIGLTVR